MCNNLYRSLFLCVHHRAACLYTVATQIHNVGQYHMHLMQKDTFNNDKNIISDSHVSTQVKYEGVTV